VTRQGKWQKEVKKDGAREIFLPSVCEQREQKSEASFAQIVSQKIRAEQK